eukprot:m.45617 g.45617  ORF g.45617 m.45617 type:complete len:681 (-) comp12190_c0_seq1:290-2332(-)
MPAQQKQMKSRSFSAKDKGGSSNPAKKAKTAFKGKDKDRSNEDGTARQPQLAKKVPSTHKEQRKMRDERKAEKNPNYTLTTELKSLWEKARVKRMSSTERAPILTQLLERSKGKMMDIIFQHDSARVIQCLIRYGSAEQRKVIFDELVEHTVALSKTKYSRHIIPKMLQYGTRQQRDTIITKFYGHVRKLIRQKIPADVLATAYVDYATSAQRTALVQEFYGPLFSLFRTRDDQTLATFIEAHPEKLKYVLKSMKTTLTPMLEKGICSHHIVHRVLLDYLLHAPEEDRTEMIDTIKPLLVEMLHTREGSRLTCFTLKYTNAKSRKEILQSFKPYVEKICMEEYGHMVILAAFDLVDDTVLLDKTLLKEIAKVAENLANDAYGRKVLLYIAAPRSAVYFSPAVVSLLTELDDSPFSKKDMPVRRGEVLAAASPFLIDLVANHAKTLCRTGHTSLLVVEILSHCIGDKTKAYDAVVTEALAKEDPLYEHASGHKMLKQLGQLVDETSPRSFAQVFLKAIDESNKVEKMLKCNRGAFVLLSLLETGVDCSTLVAEIRAYVPRLGDELSPGLKLLVQALENVKNGKYVKDEEDGDDETGTNAPAEESASKVVEAEPEQSKASVTAVETVAEDSGSEKPVKRAKSARNTPAKQAAKKADNVVDEFSPIQTRASRRRSMAQTPKKK